MENTGVTFLLPSCLSGELYCGFTPRCEEGLYQHSVSLGTTEEVLEANGKLASAGGPNATSVTHRPRGSSRPSSFPKLCRNASSLMGMAAAEILTPVLQSSSTSSNFPFTGTISLLTDPKRPLVLFHSRYSAHL